MVSVFLEMFHVFITKRITDLGLQTLGCTFWAWPLGGKNVLWGPHSGFVSNRGAGLPTSPQDGLDPWPQLS